MDTDGYSQFSLVFTKAMKHPLWLLPLFTFFSIVKLDHVNVESEPQNPAENAASDTNVCSVQAWVRAPDLSPGEIIPGQVKVRTKGPCDPISEYSLILRFKERVWVNSRKPDNASIIEVSGIMDKLQGLPFEKSRLQEFMNFTVQSSEEERVGFESKYQLFEGHQSSEIQSVHDFALLVPTTNYPPSELTAPFSSRTNIFETQKIYNEHISLYTVEVKFTNGTVIEIPAGYTSFNNAGSNSRNNTSEIVTITANFTELNQNQKASESYSPSDRSHLIFDVNVTFPNGRNLEQGSTHDLVFTRASSNLENGPNIVLHQPVVMGLHLTSQARRMETLLSEENITFSTIELGFIYCQIVPTYLDSELFDLCWRANNGMRHYTSTPEWATTTSVAFQVSDIVFPSFDMYYQSLEAKFMITLRLKGNTVLNLDAASNDDEDYDWTPTLTTSQTFYTEIPVTIHPRTRTKLGDINMTHYLSPDARQPLFVDPSTSSVTGLLQLTVEERNLLAPKCSPVIVNKDSSIEKIFQSRYYESSPHYVGNTWLRKVLSRAESQNLEAIPVDAEEKDDVHTLLVQTGL